MPKGGFLQRITRPLRSETPEHRMDAGESDLAPGDLLLGERVEKILSGGMGTIYLTPTHAFKTLSAKALGGIKGRFFAKEIDTWLRLPTHTNIVKAYTVAPAYGRVFLVLERIHGHDLQHIIHAEKYTLSQALGWAREICEGMRFVHEARRLVHRDLKPANILIDGQGTAHVTDFGLASLLQGSGAILARGGFNASVITQIGNRVGTPAYMAPEQWEGARDIDTRADVYSFGILLYELLCRRHPFEGACWSLQELWDKHLHAQPPDPKVYNTQLPGEVVRIVSKCLQKAPAQRYQAFAHLVEDLRSL